MKTFVSKVFIIFGLICLIYAGFLLWERNNPQRLSFAQAPIVQKTVQTIQQPKEITIPSVGIDLPVFSATILDGVWQTTTQGASYLSLSPIPGQKGNSIIYAHNWTSLFGPLVGVKPGENIAITYPDGSKKMFTVTYTTTVSPKDISILAPSQDTRITLYTCTGLFDSKRFVVVALLMK